MLWLVLALIATAALLLWKRSISKPLPQPETISRRESAPVSPNLSPRAAEPATVAMRAPVESPPSKDAWEDWSDELYAQASRELTVDLAITYCDRNGQITRRDITVEKYARTADGGVLAAYCHLRQARRPFYFSRIKSAADRVDGVVIEDLGAWLDEKYEASSNGKRDRFIQNHEAALGALFFVAKADDAFSAKEKEVFRAFCSAQGIDEPTIQNLVVETVSLWVIPSRIAYGRDLRAMVERDVDYRQSVLDHAHAIVNTGKRVREEESRALERMQRELQLPVQPM